MERERLSVEDCVWVVKSQAKIDVRVRTLWRDAEKVAFGRVRKIAKKKGCDRIYYRSYSGQNPDFMNGATDFSWRTDRTPHYYVIDAILF